MYSGLSNQSQDEQADLISHRAVGPEVTLPSTSLAEGSEDTLFLMVSLL